MNYHINATTNKVQRLKIQKSDLSVKELSKQLCVSEKTVRKWRKRKQVTDKSSRPDKVSYALNEGEEQTVVIIRRLTWAASYDVAEAVSHVVPKANQTNVSRIFKRYQVNRKPKEERKRKQFKKYEPGFIHIDLTYVPKLEGKKKYLFVAVDRATRLMYVELRDRRSQEEARKFLKGCKRFYPFRIKKILTDNGSEFTNREYKRKSRKKDTKLREHNFEKECKESEIEHRMTKIKHPWTNGMVERMNGVIKENTIKIHRYRSYKELEEDVKGFEMKYNILRKHNSISRKTPYQQMEEWYIKRKELFRISPQQWLNYHYSEQRYEN